MLLRSHLLLRQGRLRTIKRPPRRAKSWKVRGKLRSLKKKLGAKSEGEGSVGDRGVGRGVETKEGRKEKGAEVEKCKIGTRRGTEKGKKGNNIK